MRRSRGGDSNIKSREGGGEVEERIRTLIDAALVWEFTWVLYELKNHGHWILEKGVVRSARLRLAENGGSGGKRWNTSGLVEGILCIVWGGYGHRFVKIGWKGLRK